MRGIVPDAILDRKDKTGFITPGHIKWLRGELSYLLDGDWQELDGLVSLPGLTRVLEPLPSWRQHPCAVRLASGNAASVPACSGRVLTSTDPDL